MLICGHSTHTKKLVSRTRNLGFEFLGYFRGRASSLGRLLEACGSRGRGRRCPAWPDCSYQVREWDLAWRLAPPAALGMRCRSREGQATGGRVAAAEFRPSSGVTSVWARGEAGRTQGLCPPASLMTSGPGPRRGGHCTGTPSSCLPADLSAQAPGEAGRARGLTAGSRV